MELRVLDQIDNCIQSIGYNEVIVFTLCNFRDVSDSE